MRNERHPNAFKVLAIVVLTAISSVMTSCDRQTLSASSAKKALEKETAFRDSSQVADFSIGYYEVDSAAIKTLNSLVKSGVIKCRIKEIPERHRFEKYTWWEGTKVYYKNIRHYFAEVALTEEGRKYVVSNPPTTASDEENLPVKDDRNMSDTLNNEFVAGVADSLKNIVPQPADGNSPENSDYTRALKKTRFSTVKVLTGFYKIEKVLNIYCPRNYQKSGIGKCNFVCTFSGITPFGIALTAHKENERAFGNADFIRYEDKGWCVDIYNISGGNYASLPMPADGQD